MSQSDETQRPYPSEDVGVTTRFIPVPRWSKWTFTSPPMRKWVESHLEGRVLNACAGKTHLRHSCEIVRNDLDEKIEANTHLDVAELAGQYPAESFDTIVYDPPWSNYQANLRYEGRHVTKTADGFLTKINLDDLPISIEGGREKQQLGHARLAKEGFAYLLKPGGHVIELTFHGTCMPSRLGFKRRERVIFDPLGEGKSVIGSVDQKVQTRLGTPDYSDNRN